MEIIKRPHYLNKLIEFKDTEFIKVLTGVRRSGKSFILKMYQNYLLEEGITKDQIIYLSFEDFNNIDLYEPKKLYSYLKEKIIPNQRMYILLDEIQFVQDWQKVINSLRLNALLELVITGSNSNLLSGELATLLSGRYVEIPVYPLSFKEMVSFRSSDPSEAEIDRLYDEYIKYGGFPAVVLAKEELKQTILSGIYNTVILNDIGYRNGLRDPGLLMLVAKYLADTVGQLINPNKIVNTLKSAQFSISYNAVQNYLSSFEQAYLFYKANRYDIAGRKILSSQGKYYIVDTGLRTQALGDKINDRGSILENIVYLELLRRGYQVQIGKLDDKEIDFIATKVNERQYIQVTYQLPENSTRETDNLLEIPNNYQKIVITGRYEEQTMISGIPIINIRDWLLADRNH
ncbi:ATP-binding protein [Lactobacillus kalixensis]|uniref:AAA+ superfamily ATPase n=1 Tax=Lactobacillus kalixensis DSM 16043 TaxID=1423763 RepID=A0A0R1U603_9LACO|nr:ATP-binding protein [Lactobacillus kalixensis]KRL88640.1 AAA+ superfamily ATPase [Lactobacillus kalixensis DSM 16043]